MIRFRACGNILKSKLHLGRALEDAAVSTDIIEGEVTEPAAPLRILPGMLDRVTHGVAGHSTASQELAVATAAVFVHAPVVRYTLRDSLVHRGGVEYAGGFVAKSRKLLDRLPLEPIATEARKSYCMSLVSHIYFGHWLTDACATALLADEAGDVILDARPDWPDTAIYARAFGLRATPAAAMRVAELQLYSDFSQGASKRRRYDTLKQRLRQSVRMDAGESRPVFLKRGASGVARPIAGEAALCERLAAAGYDIIDLAATDFNERYRRLAAASIVVTVDGSHVNHAFFAMRAGAGVVSLIPSDRFTMRERGVAHGFGLNYGCVVMQPSEAGYVADPEEIFRTVDLF